jgi:hypothetical protein
MRPASGAPMGVCKDCPLFSTHDALYENITGQQIEPTYEWWYEQWVKGYNGLAIPYAFERMLTYVTESTRSIPERGNERRFPELASVWNILVGSPFVLVIALLSILLNTLFWMHVMHVLLFGHTLRQRLTCKRCSTRTHFRCRISRYPTRKNRVSKISNYKIGTAIQLIVPIRSENSRKRSSGFFKIALDNLSVSVI